MCAERLCVKAHGDEQELQAVLEIEGVVLDNEEMGRRDGRLSRSPWATGKLAPRACGSTQTPHGQTGGAARIERLRWVGRRGTDGP